MYSTPSLSYPDFVLPDRLWFSSKGVNLELIACRSAVPCPCCAHLSHRIHSHYVRTLADLPWQEKTVCIHLHARRFFCTNGQCKTRIFTERFPEFVVPYGRRTLALHQALHLIGLALGGRAGARLAQGLKMRVARDSILRALRRWPEETSSYKESSGLRVVGIDDWAFRKGQRYGTIFCDLERHCVLDLLDDRNCQSAAAWFRAHPEIQIISRDRGGIYAEAAREGTPQAIQIADRFHLLKNLVDMMQRVASNEQTLFQALFREASPPPANGPVSGEAPEVDSNIQRSPDSQIKVRRKLTRAQAIKEERRQKKRERYEQVMTLRKKGVSVKNIADQVGISRRTTQRLLHAVAFPDSSTRAKRLKIIEPYRRHLDQRWENGCHNAAQLFREVQAQGFRGSYAVVYAYLFERYESGTRDLGEGGARASLGLCSVPSPRQAAWLFLYPAKSLALVERREGVEVSKKQAAVLHQILVGDSPLTTVILLARQFIEMVTKRQPEVLDTWIQTALDSGMKELGRFARSIVQDYAAIRAALELDISNGQVEGQVNRLKMIKRQMYGRAGLDLLKTRLITPLRAPI